MSAFTYEIANVNAAVLRAYPEHPQGIYALPWYLIVGNPGSGRTAALHAMGLTWSGDDGPLAIGLPQQLNTYWMPKEAVFIEPEVTVLGPNRQKENLKLLCDDLAAARPREPVDGILLVLSIADFADLDERGLEDYANQIRRYLVEINERLRVDVPVYVLLTRYDAIWGFAEVFQWTPERKREDPWGFTLPYETDSQTALPRIQEQLSGLHARVEGFCIAKICSEDPPEQRIRGFQHLAEARALMEKIRSVFSVIAMTNAFERAPWIRAVALGSALPGQGDRLRAGVGRFFNMGYGQGSNAPTGRPGGLPIHQYMSTVILPERDIVPLRTRWREDKLIQLCVIFAALLWVGAIITGVIFAVSGPPAHNKAIPPPPKAAPHK